MRTTPLFALALAACQPTFDTIDDACTDKVSGSKNSDEVAVAVFQRVGCYRRFAKMTPATIDDKISDAALAHSLYIEQNGPDANPLTETSGNPSFSGATPLDRIAAQGYDVTAAGGVGGIGFWEGAFVNDPSFDPAAIADGWMWGQYTRQGILQPAWLDAGYGANDSFAVITILYTFPASEASRKPVAWPRDGQTDVPPRWAYEYDDGFRDLFDEVGYPVTFTVGSDDSSSVLDSPDPYSLTLYDSTLEGPDGEVSHIAITPESSPYDFPYTVALVPDAPYLPHETYTATVRLKWNSRDSVGEFTTTFTTGDDPAGATSRRVPQPLRVTERAPGGRLQTWTP